MTIDRFPINTRPINLQQILDVETATGEDRVQTGLDRVQTGLDRVQTGLDRVQTGLDRVQTTADRVVTTADRIATQSAARFRVKTFAELSSTFGYAGSGRLNIVAAGDVAEVMGIGFYTVLASGASGAHLDYTGTGGVKLTVLRGDRGFNARAFGANGDDATNDTTALAAWIVACQNGEGFLPFGIYRHTGLTLLPQYSYNISGEAYDNNAIGGSVLYNTSTGNAITIDNTPFTGNYDSQMRLSNMTVKGNASSGNGFEVDQTMVFLENVWITSHGGHGYNATRCYSSSFRQVSFSNNSECGFFANRALNAVHFDHCLFNGNAAADGFAGLYLAGAGGDSRHFGVTFTSCDFTGNGGSLGGAEICYGALIQHSSGVTFTGCYGESNKSFNLYADSTVYGLNVLGCFWRDSDVSLVEVNGLHWVGNEMYSSSESITFTLDGGLPDKRLEYAIIGTTYTGTVSKIFTGGATESAEWSYTEAPTGGTWKLGDRVWNSNAQGGGYIQGWVCITAGTPGAWMPIGVLPDIFENHGNAGATLTPGTSLPINIWASPITSDRTVTLSTTGVWRGATFKIVRTAGATGAFNVVVGGLKNLAAGQWCEVGYNGFAWTLIAFGSFGRAEDGTNLLPGMAFTSDPDTGFYRPASDEVGVATNGVLRATFSNNTLTMGSGVEILGDSGTAALPGYAFNGDQDTGIYSYGANVLGFSAGAGWIMRMDAEGLKFNTGKQVLTSSGEVGLPSLSFLTDTDTGFYNPATNTLGIVNAGTEYSRIASSGSHRFGDLTTDNVGTSGTAGVSIAPIGAIQIARDNTLLTLNRTDGDGTEVSFRRLGVSVGSIAVSAGATAYNTSSDYRLKIVTDAPEDFDIEARILALDGALTWFTWIAHPQLGPQFGALAHVLQAVAPQAVSGIKDAVDAETGDIVPQGVDYSKLVPELVAGLADALRRIKELEQA